MIGNDDALKYDIALRYFNVNLLNYANYSTNITIQSVPMTMRCGYNTRNRMRWIYLEDLNGEILLPQTFIKYGKRVEMNFNSDEANLNYYITLKPKDSAKIIPDSYDYLNWKNDFDICFVGYEYSLVERLEVNGRKTFVGN